MPKTKIIRSFPNVLPLIVHGVVLLFSPIWAGFVPGCGNYEVNAVTPGLLGNTERRNIINNRSGSHRDPKLEALQRSVLIAK